MKETRGTADWAYRCSADGTDAAATIELLTDEGFLWRSVHNRDGNKIANVKKIEIGDSIHVYVADAGIERYLSSHLVQRPSASADPDAPVIEAVRDERLIEKLTKAGYEVDPVLECFTGFRLQKDNYPKIPDARPRWVGRNAITRIAR